MVMSDDSESIYDAYAKPKRKKRADNRSSSGDASAGTTVDATAADEALGGSADAGAQSHASDDAAASAKSVETAAAGSADARRVAVSYINGDGAYLFWEHPAIKLCLITITLILFILLIITFLGLIIPEAETVKPILMDFVIGTVICLVFAVVVLLAYVTTSPKVVRFDGHGITIGAKLPGGLMREEQLSWQSIARVTMEKRLIGGEPYVVLQQFPQYGDRKKWIRWKELYASVSLGSFINAIKTWAPGAVLNIQLPASEETSERSPSYTELWLRYFSSPARRDRLCELPEGHILGAGRYRIIGIIGGGGQGTTYLATRRIASSLSSNTSNDPGGNQESDLVAVKEYILPLHRGTTVLEQTSHRLAKEASILQRVQHDQIVKLLECFVEDYRGYLVLEYVSGKSLKQLVLEQGGQPERLVADIAIQLCGILDYLHGLSPPVVHRDLTPDNLILEPSGRIKLVDFNVAQQIEQTTNATVVGKHAYVPPEQFRGKATTQSDIYALGCTMFCLATGRDPEPITTSYPRQFNKMISPELDAIVARATYLDPALRFRDAFELKSALTELA